MNICASVQLVKTEPFGQQQAQKELRAHWVKDRVLAETPTELNSEVPQGKTPLISSTGIFDYNPQYCNNPKQTYYNTDDMSLL